MAIRATMAIRMNVSLGNEKRKIIRRSGRSREAEDWGAVRENC
jgi:hypothetical protein